MLSLLSLFLIGAAQAQGSHSAAQIASEIKTETYAPRLSWLQKEHEIYSRCLQPSFAKTRCAYFPNRSPLKPLHPAIESGNRIMAEVLKQDAPAELIKACAVRVFVPGNRAYWLEQEIESNYAGLKCEIARKRQREKLSDCQAACVATCISSKIIDYDPSLMAPLRSRRAAVCQGKGVCREFSLVASELMGAASVVNRTALGTLYKEQTGSKTEQGGHVMTEVTLAEGRFLMEPQSAGCSFYSPRFDENPSLDADKIEYLKR